jgi:hypothetical protein
MTRLFAIVSYLTIRRGGAIWLACLASVAAPFEVHAQPSKDRAVIPVVIESAGVGSEAFRRSARIREARGAEFRSVEETRAAFEERASAAPIELQAEDIDRWLDHKEAATKHLAHQDYVRAAASLKAAQEVSERAIEALNRETAMARTVLDTCLYVVRGLWETGKTAQAEEQARECRRLVPQIQPTMTLHTPTVRSIIDQIDRERQEEAAATLEVKSPRKGCLVRLNGLHLGTTPFMMAELIPGEYRVQVECDKDRPGRVHRIDLHDDATLWIDPTLDDAVRTEPEVHLIYPSEEAFSEEGALHAQGLARMLDVATVILVAPYEMKRVERELGVVGTVPLRADASALNAVDQLLRIEVSSAGSIEAPQEKGTPAHRRRVRKAVGGTLAGGGAVSLAVAAGLYARRVNRGDEFSQSTPGTPEYDSARKEWEDARLGVLLAAPLGAVLLATGEALTYSPRSRVPPWTWGFGAAGVGLMTWGIVEMATADRCDRDLTITPACVSGQESVDRGVLLLSAGVPLAFLPVWAVTQRSKVEIQASGAGLMVRGEF